MVASNWETRNISARGTPVYLNQKCSTSEQQVRTKEESHWVEDVAQNQLQCEGMDSESTANPGQQTVDGGDQRQDSQNVGPIESSR